MKVKWPAVNLSLPKGVEINHRETMLFGPDGYQMSLGKWDREKMEQHGEILYGTVEKWQELLGVEITVLGCPRCDLTDKPLDEETSTKAKLGKALRQLNLVQQERDKLLGANNHMRIALEKIQGDYRITVTELRKVKQERAELQIALEQYKTRQFLTEGIAVDVVNLRRERDELRKQRTDLDEKLCKIRDIL